MAQSAPKIIHYTDDETAKLHTGVSDNLKQAGHNVNPQALNPQEDSIPHNIEHTAHDLLRVAGQTIEEKTVGSTFVSGTSSKEPLSILKTKKSKMAQIFSKWK